MKKQDGASWPSVLMTDEPEGRAMSSLPMARRPARVGHTALDSVRSQSESDSNLWTHLCIS